MDIKQDLHWLMLSLTPIPVKFKKKGYNRY